MRPSKIVSIRAQELALACGSQGETPQLVFSAPVKEVTLTALRKLVRLEPSVPDLHFRAEGSRVTLLGRFVPDVLYRMQLGPAPLQDDGGRPLRDPGGLQLYFHLGWKTPFLRLNQSTAVLEAMRDKAQWPTMPPPGPLIRLRIWITGPTRSEKRFRVNAVEIWQK